MNGVVSFVTGILYTLTLLYVFVMLGRLVMDWIPFFNREWRPTGLGLVVAEVVYTITDPPIRFFRRIIPPIRMGSIALDLGFTLTMLLCFMLLSIFGALAQT